jgi:hypothetical protein
VTTTEQQAQEAQEQAMYAQIFGADIIANQWRNKPVITSGTDHNNAVVVVRRLQWFTEGDDINPRPWECPHVLFSFGRIETHYDSNGTPHDGIMVNDGGWRPTFLCESNPCDGWLGGANVTPFVVSVPKYSIEERYSYLILGNGETPPHYADDPEDEE